MIEPEPYAIWRTLNNTFEVLDRGVVYANGLAQSKIKQWFYKLEPLNGFEYTTCHVSDFRHEHFIVVGRNLCAALEMKYTPVKTKAPKSDYYYPRDRRGETKRPPPVKCMDLTTEQATVETLRRVEARLERRRGYRVQEKKVKALKKAAKDVRL